MRGRVTARSRRRSSSATSGCCTRSTVRPAATSAGPCRSWATEARAAGPTWSSPSVGVTGAKRSRAGPSTWSTVARRACGGESRASRATSWAMPSRTPVMSTATDGPTSSQERRPSVPDTPTCCRVAPDGCCTASRARRTGTTTAPPCPVSATSTGTGVRTSSSALPGMPSRPAAPTSSADAHTGPRVLPPDFDDITGRSGGAGRRGPPGPTRRAVFRVLGPRRARDPRLGR